MLNLPLSILIDKKCLALISENVDRSTKYHSLRKTRLYVLNKINFLMRMISFLTINGDSGQSILLKKSLAISKHQNVIPSIKQFSRTGFLTVVIYTVNEVLLHA